METSNTAGAQRRRPAPVLIDFSEIVTEMRSISSSLQDVRERMAVVESWSAQLVAIQAEQADTRKRIDMLERNEATREGRWSTMLALTAAASGTIAAIVGAILGHFWH